MPHLLLLSFAALLMVAVLISERAHRTVLSTAVLFLLAQLALFSVLFTDGMRVAIRDLRSAWRLPGRRPSLDHDAARDGGAVGLGPPPTRMW